MAQRRLDIPVLDHAFLIDTVGRRLLLWWVGLLGGRGNETLDPPPRIFSSASRTVLRSTRRRMVSGRAAMDGVDVCVSSISRRISLRISMKFSTSPGRYAGGGYGDLWIFEEPGAFASSPVGSGGHTHSYLGNLAGFKLVGVESSTLRSRRLWRIVSTLIARPLSGT